MSYADNYQSQLSDMAGNDPDSNTVGSFFSKIFNPSTDTSGDSTGSNSLASTLTKAASSAASHGKYADSPLGSGFYNSPPMIAQRYMELGKFFKGAEPGNEYTNHFQTPQKPQNPKAETLNAFYNQWYEKMRQFAEAEQVATRGQVQTRSR